MTIMLVPNPPRAEEESPLPPPYTPPTSVSAENLHVYLEANLRGGDVRPSVLQDNHQLPSAAAYFEDRPCTIPYPSYILYYPLIFTPNATRDDFPFPQPEHQYRSRDLLEHDWNTFLNYLLPPEMEPGRSKDRVRRLRSKDALRDQDRIEALLAEWHQGFFAPRGIRLEARFPGSDPLSTTPPPPFTSTADVAHLPEASASSAEDVPFRLEVSQPSMPPQPPMPHGQSPLQWARNNIIGQRFGSGPFARLLPDNSNKNNEQRGNHGDCSACDYQHPHEMRERRGRSSSFSCSSSSSRSSSDSGYGGRGPHHHHFDWPGHHGRHPHHAHHGPGHHHRHRSSSPPSSSSSSTSTSSPSSSSLASLSISSSSLSATSPHLIHNAISTLRQYQHHPDRTTLVSTLRNFKAEIRAAKKHQHRESTTTTPTTPTTHSTQPPPRTLKNDLKAQRKTLKNELKAFVKEAKAVRKAERKARKAEKKGRRKQRRAEKKELKRMGRKGGGGGGERKEEGEEARAERKVVLEKEVARIMAAEPGGGVGERERTTSSDLANRIMEGKWGVDEGMGELGVEGQEKGVAKKYE